MQSFTPPLSYVLSFLLAIFFSFSWSRPVLDSCWFVLTCVELVLIRVDLCRTCVGWYWNRVDSCWLVLGVQFVFLRSFYIVVINKQKYCFERKSWIAMKAKKIMLSVLNHFWEKNTGIENIYKTGKKSTKCHVDSCY